MTKARSLFFQAAVCVLLKSHVVDAQNCAVADPLPSITDIACTTDEFSTACALLEAAGLDLTLDAGGPFTIFLPNNEGFSNLGQDLIDLLLDAENAATLEEVLLNHVLDSETVVLSEDLVCDVAVPMLSGETTTTICVERTEDILQLGQGNLALNQDEELLPNIVEADVLACNGVVHQISNVILPQSIADLVTDSDQEDEIGSDEPNLTEPECTPNIVDVACEDENLSILCSALQATDLDAVLNQAGPFTVFAPIDDAFLALGENTLAALLEEVVGLESLTDILLYHVVPNESILADELICLGELQMANGEFTRTLCHSRSGRSFQIGYGNSYRNFPEIVVPDITNACNGVVHVINKVIFPKPASYTSSGQVKKSSKSDKSSKSSDKAAKVAKSNKSKKFKRSKW